MFFFDLPIEIISHILDYLTPKDWCRCMNSCKLFMLAMDKRKSDIIKKIKVYLLDDKKDYYNNLEILNLNFEDYEKNLLYEKYGRRCEDFLYDNRRCEGLIYVCENGYIDLIELFINDCKACFDHETFLYEALDMAITNHHIEVVEYLINHNKEYKEYDLDYVMSGSTCVNDINIINLMISKGAKDWNGCMFNAISVGNMDLVKFFLSKNKENTCYDNGGNSLDLKIAMYHSIASSNKDMIDLFIKEGFNDWNYAMEVTADFNFGDEDILKFFIEKGGSIDAYYNRRRLFDNNIIVIKNVNGGF